MEERGGNECAGKDREDEEEDFQRMDGSTEELTRKEFRERLLLSFSFQPKTESGRTILLAGLRPCCWL